MQLFWLLRILRGLVDPRKLGRGRDMCKCMLTPNASSTLIHGGKHAYICTHACVNTHAATACMCCLFVCNIHELKASVHVMHGRDGVRKHHHQGMGRSDLRSSRGSTTLHSFISNTTKKTTQLTTYTALETTLDSALETKEKTLVAAKPAARMPHCLEGFRYMCWYACSIGRGPPPPTPSPTEPWNTQIVML